MNVVEKAEMVATWAHRGQTDMAGKDYIEHLKRVADRVKTRGEYFQAVAWLHDVVEDSEITLTDLYDMGFPHEVTVAVDAITQRGNKQDGYEDLEEYWARVKANPIALQVKFADIAENNSDERKHYLPQEKQDKLTAKYKRALEFLNA